MYCAPLPDLRSDFFLSGTLSLKRYEQKNLYFKDIIAYGSNRSVVHQNIDLEMKMEGELGKRLGIIELESSSYGRHSKLNYDVTTLFRNPVNSS